eukprot:478056-Rhodomonas_salina.1
MCIRDSSYSPHLSCCAASGDRANRAPGTMSAIILRVCSWRVRYHPTRMLTSCPLSSYACAHGVSAIILRVCSWRVRYHPT